jgi:hypothetical protein
MLRSMVDFPKAKWSSRGTSPTGGAAEVGPDVSSAAEIIILAIAFQTDI